MDVQKFLFIGVDGNLSKETLTREQTRQITLALVLIVDSVSDCLRYSVFSKFRYSLSKLKRERFVSSGFFEGEYLLLCTSNNKSSDLL